MLVCSRIDVSYRTGESLISPLKNLNLEVSGGSVALMGPSGSGKSTLLRVIAGLQKPDAGTVVIDGRAIAHAERHPEMDIDVSMIHQDYRLVSFLDVRDNLQIALRFKGKESAPEERVDEVLEKVQLGGFADRKPDTLSGGQRQRVAIARALLVGSRVLLADEPTGSLDREVSNAIADLLQEIGETQGVVVIAATHDHEVAHKLDRIVQLEDLCTVS